MDIRKSHEALYKKEVLKVMKIENHSGGFWPDSPRLIGRILFKVPSRPPTLVCVCVWDKRMWNARYVIIFQRNNGSRNRYDNEILKKSSHSTSITSSFMSISSSSSSMESLFPVFPFSAVIHGPWLSFSKVFNCVVKLSEHIKNVFVKAGFLKTPREWNRFLKRL